MSSTRNRLAAVAAGATILVTFGSLSAVAANLIGSADIRNGGVHKIDVGRAAVGDSEIVQGSVDATELSAGVNEKLNETGATGPKGDRGPAAETTVSNLAGNFTKFGTEVSLTGDGVAFGPYTDGGNEHGTICNSALRGQQLSSLTNLAYYGRYMATGDTGGVGAPYLTVWTDSDAHTATFSPSTQLPDTDVAEGPFHEWVATSGSWRYDDMAGNAPDMSFASLTAAHGSQTISDICITTGSSAGSDLSALVRWMEINGQKFAFRG